MDVEPKEDAEEVCQREGRAIVELDGAGVNKVKEKIKCDGKKTKRRMLYRINKKDSQLLDFLVYRIDYVR